MAHQKQFYSDCFFYIKIIFYLKRSTHKSASTKGNISITPVIKIKLPNIIIAINRIIKAKSPIPGSPAPTPINNDNISDIKKSKPNNTKNNVSSISIILPSLSSYLNFSVANTYCKNF